VADLDRKRPVVWVDTSGFRRIRTPFWGIEIGRWVMTQQRRANGVGTVPAPFGWWTIMFGLVSRRLVDAEESAGGADRGRVGTGRVRNIGPAIQIAGLLQGTGAEPLESQCARSTG
jgi:hypothetical protein